MESQPSTLAGTSKAAAASDGGGHGRSPTDGLEEGVASTSGSAAAVQQQDKQVILNRMTLKQCQQLFQTTCLVKLQRCDEVTTTASGATPSTTGVHTEEKPYICMVDGCGKSFRHSFTLKKHCQLIHLKKY